MTVCVKCAVDKVDADFYRCPAKLNGLQSWCKGCTKTVRDASRKANPEHHRAVTDAWRARNQDRILRYRLMAAFGITPEEYDAQLALQGGVCAVPRCKSDTKLVVDHCHTEGRLRGIICWSHNVGLGHIGDTIDAAEAAVSYLKGAVWK